MNEILPTSEEEASARYKFLLRFADPFRVLEERGKGDFVALSIGLFLCERYFRYKSKTIDLWREEGFLAEAARHFETDYSFFKDFWEVYRHGMQYEGAPKANDNYGWDMKGDYPPMPTKALEEGKAMICLNPWTFTQEMIVLCWYDPIALAGISTYSLGSAAGPLKWELVPPVKSPRKD